jgi:two-component system, OmpR family, response regulator
MAKHVTIVEDDPDVRAVLERSLGGDGYQVTALESGTGIEEVMSSGQVDLVILDIGLPDIDGITIIQQIRQHSDVAIIIVSGRGDLADRVVGLEVGADDYITKPFEPREFLARVRSVLRRGRCQHAVVPQVDDDRKCYYFGNWTLDTTAQSLLDAEGRPIGLSSGEFKLLEVLVTNAKLVLSRNQLMDACYGNTSSGFARGIDGSICRLRRKLKDDPRNAGMIRTIRNDGYYFAARVRRYRQETSLH